MPIYVSILFWQYWPTKGCSLNAKGSCLIHINTLAETTERFFPASRFNYTFTHRPSYTRQASADSLFHQQSPGQNTQWAWIGINLFRNQIVFLFHETNVKNWKNYKTNTKTLQSSCFKTRSFWDHWNLYCMYSYSYQKNGYTHLLINWKKKFHPTYWIFLYTTKKIHHIHLFFY